MIKYIILLWLIIISYRLQDIKHDMHMSRGEHHMMDVRLDRMGMGY
jgi:hypothetical protein